MKQLESGAASLKVELHKGVISVYHGTDGVLLFSRPAYEGDWGKLFNQLKNN